MSGVGLGAIALLPAWGCLHQSHSAILSDPVKRIPMASISASAPPTTVTSPATTTTAETTVAFFKFGIRLVYPPEWKPEESKDYELLLLPTKRTAALAAYPLISLDVPELPPHFPGMIPIGLVKNGYLDDLKKEVGKGTLDTQESSPKVAGSQGRMLRSTWEGKEGQSLVETALVLIHADRVYILRARFEATDRMTLQTFDGMVQSIQWDK